MTVASKPTRRDRLLTLAPIAGGLVAAALTAAGLLTLASRAGETRERPGTAPSAGQVLTTPPPGAVQQVHDAMHDIAARCHPGVDAGAPRELHRDVDVILDFAKRYPDAQFPIDDETGRTLSLLIGVRDDLRKCAPAIAERITPALPPRYRHLPSGTS